jgi:succinate dehydrogenase/fumarate reductase flavoprotein subunit
MGWETQNMLTVARCMAQAALAREESRGTHFRSDFPQPDDGRFLGHLILHRAAEGIRQTFEPLTP